MAVGIRSGTERLNKLSLATEVSAVGNSQYPLNTFSRDGLELHLTIGRSVLHYFVATKILSVSVTKCLTN